MNATNYSAGVNPGNKTITALFEAEYRRLRRPQHEPAHRDGETRQQFILRRFNVYYDSFTKKIVNTTPVDMKQPGTLKLNGFSIG